MEVGILVERMNDVQLLEDDTEDETDDEEEDLTVNEDQLANQARDYQLELYNYALERNSIVCLKPGSGKTFIIVLLIKELQHEILKPFDMGGKVTFFLMRKVALLAQQAQSIESHTILKVGQYHGSCWVDVNGSKCTIGDWNQDVWAKEFQGNQVFVAKAKILLHLLKRNFITMDRINLIVMDECHRATGKDPYCRIMKFYQRAITSKPKILGLTAEVLPGRCKPANIAANIEKLELTLDSRIISNLEQVNKVATKPQEVLLEYSAADSSNTDLDLKIEETLVRCENEIKRSQDANGMNLKCSPDYLVKSVRAVYQILGIWPMREILKSLLDYLPNFETQSSDQPEGCKIISSILKEHFTKLHDLVTSVIDAMGDSRAILTFATPKVKRLLDLLKITIESTLRFRGIVFVEQGSIAWMLDRYLRQLKQLHLGDYEQVDSCYVVGRDSKLAYPWHVGMNAHEQTESLLLFKNGQRNLLIGTCVVEEGVDIPECNVVIRFDWPATFCSYVHSKGKARAQKALFFLMHSDGDKGKVLNTLVHYRVLEEELNKISMKNKQR